MYCRLLQVSMIAPICVGWSSLWLNMKRNQPLPCFCCIRICDWCRMLAPSTKPIRRRFNINHGLVTVFPERLVVCLFFLLFFFLVHDFSLCCDGWSWLIWRWLMDNQLKNALYSSFETQKLTHVGILYGWLKNVDWFISSGITSVNESLQASNFLWMINIFRIIPIFSHVYLFWVVTYNVTILFSHRSANHSFSTSFVAEQINPFNIPYSVIYPNKNVTTTTRQENVKKNKFSTSIFNGFVFLF